MTFTVNGYKYKGVQQFKDRHGRRRFYLRANGATLPDPADGFRAWDQAYHDAIGLVRSGEKPPKKRPATSPEGTVEKAVRAYYKSEKFEKIAEATQDTRKHYLDNWVKIVGGYSLADLKKADIEAGMANRADKPKSANNWFYAVRSLMKFCVAQKLIKADPTMGVELFKGDDLGPKTGGWLSWTEADVAAFIKRHPKGTLEYKALMVLVWVGQRRADVVRLGWHMVGENGMTVFSQQKTDKPMNLPLHPDLLEVLGPRPDGVIGKPTPWLLTPTGKPFSGPYFTEWFRTACEKVPGLASGKTPHGLRKLSAKRLRKAGAPLAVIMALTGHSTEANLRVYLEDVETEEMGAEVANYWH